MVLQNCEPIFIAVHQRFPSSREILAGSSNLLLQTPLLVSKFLAPL